MRIKEVINGGVLLALDPGECLMLAEACGKAAEWSAEAQQHSDDAIYSLTAAHFEALALLGSVSNHVVKQRALLTEWTLPRVRRDWSFIGSEQGVPQ